jgi:hypothetical protein
MGWRMKDLRYINWMRKRQKDICDGRPDVLAPFLLIFFILGPGKAFSQTDTISKPTGTITVKVRPGIAYIKPDPKIFGGYSLLKSKNYDLALSKIVRPYFALNLDLEFRKTELTDILKTRYSFADIAGFSGGSVFGPVKTVNAILSVEYLLNSKNGKSVLDLAIGGGYQRIQRSKSLMTFVNPHRFGALDTVYFAPHSNVNGVVAQAGIHYTYFISPKAGLQIGGRIQYNGTYSDIKYNTVKADDNGKISTKNYCNCETVTGSTIEPVDYILEAVVVLRFGPADKHISGINDHTGVHYQKPDTTNYNKPCKLAIWPKNINTDAACYDTSMLSFGVTSARHDGLLKIYAAPISDLSDKRLLTTISSDASQLTISAALFDIGLKYFITAEFVHKGEVSCAEGCPIPPRCDTLCGNTGKGAVSGKKNKSHLKQKTGN